MNGEISHVSDTALMVAAARAKETARPDGLVHDPFAERLAGERGMAILNGIERIGMLSFGIGIRSRFMDEFVAGLIADARIGRVISLGAGLDTRPYRLPLPADLHWTEVDLPDMIDYKEELLADASPHCQLDRISADLTDPHGRAQAFAGADDRTLVITEGLLMYLPRAAVEAIIASGSAAGYWLVELVSPEFARRVNMSSCQSIEAVRAPDCLDGMQTLALFRAAGWNTRAWRNYRSDILSTAPERVMELMQQHAATGAPPPPPPDPNEPSGVYLFEHK